MKLYLGHPFELRKEVRKVELVIEEMTGIELLNPFYDTGRTDIYDVDIGLKTRSSLERDCNAIVENDLACIDSCDSLLAVVPGNVSSLGTLFEVWYAFSAGKKVYILSKNVLEHPWIRYIISHSGGKGFESWEEFVKEFKKET